MKCQKCGFPMVASTGHPGPYCKCFSHYSPDHMGRPLRLLTDDDVRRIVREELAAKEQKP